MGDESAPGQNGIDDMVDERRFQFVDPKQASRDLVVAGSRSYDAGAALLEAFESGSSGEVHAVPRSDGMSESFLSTFALALADSWEVSEFDRRLAAALSDLPTAIGMDSMTDVGEPWMAVGRSLGFDGLRDGLAVIVDEPHRYPQDGVRLVDKVREVVERLDEAGYGHAAVLVVGSKLSHALRDSIHEAGGEVLDVPEVFFEMNDPTRRSLLVSLFPPAEARRAPARCAKNPDAVRGDYAARNPELTETDVARWRERLAGGADED